MIYLGGLFVLRDWAGVLKRYELYVGIVVKMVLFPIAFHALLVAVPPMLGLGGNPPQHGGHDDDHRGTADHERHRHVFGTRA